jgi:mRNA interferase RelE/StbE
MRDVLQQLADQPRGVQTKRLAGSSDYRRRVGDYRIVYEIDDKALLVTINAVRHRKDAYRG